MGNISVKALKDNYRNDFVKALASKLGDDVGYVASNELNMPIVLPNGDESWITVKVSIPAGSRDGVAYDGYEARKNYDRECADREVKAQAKAEAKARKIAKAEADRKAKAEAKAKKELESK